MRQRSCRQDSFAGSLGAPFQYQGNEAYPIAEALAARGIPFVFSTGYGKQSLRAPYSDRPALQKPFKRHDLQKRLAELSF